MGRRGRDLLFWGILAPFLILCIGCTPSNRQRELSDWMAADGKIRIVTTVQMTRDLVARIGGDQVAVISLISNGLDPHSYELVKGDDELLYAADVIFAVGLGLEHGASLAHLLSAISTTTFLGECLLKNSPAEIIRVDRATDPHIWMDISLFAKTIPAIVERLSSLDPEHADLFKKRGDELYKELIREHERISTLLHSVESKKRYLVTTHDAFNYFTRAYLCNSPKDEQERRQRCMAPEGLAPDMQLSFYDIQRVVDHLERFSIRKIFPEANLSKDALLKIVQAASDRGLEVELVQESLYGDSVMIQEADSKEGAYLAMMAHNAQLLYDNMR